MRGWAARGAFWGAWLAAAAWGAVALWVQFSGPARLGAWAALALALLVAGGLRRAGARFGWAGLVATALALLLWYQGITPRQDRDWAVDVSRGVVARVAGEEVTLSNLRDFDWTSADSATPRWTTRRYSLAELESTDMITSVWSNPLIAHLLVSFGFKGGEHVVFSVEIRRETGEEFNEIGGFFRQFELVLIGATERDIVKLRTNFRKEEVRLYPLTLTPEARRALFLAYLDLARRLEEKPQFYNTLTANCTTVVYHLAKRLWPGLRPDWRIVASGELPAYLESLGILGGEGALSAREAAALITPRAQSAGEAADFSAAIRAR